MQMDIFPKTSVEDARKMVGRFGITGRAQTMAIKSLSDGLRSRVVFSRLAHECASSANSILPLSD